MAVKRRQPERKKDHAKPSTTVSIIGSGRLGTALMLALAARGYVIEAVVASHKSSARRAARLCGLRPRALTSAQLARLPSSDILFITTPDDAILSTSLRLATTFGERQRGRTALHASGALTSAVLDDLRAAGFATGSLHPLISVSDSVPGAESLKKAFYCIEGDAAAARVARRIVRDLGAHSFSIKARDKALYHAAAVMASGHTVALFQTASQLLESCGLTEKRARAVLLPLVQSTIENLSVLGPRRALTGTFARADLKTVHRHLEAFSARSLTEALLIYALLGERSIELVQSAGVTSTAAKEIRRELQRVLAKWAVEKRR